MWEEVRSLEPLDTLRRAPVTFLLGFCIIALGVILLAVFLHDRNFEPWVVTQAAFQGAGYLILYRLCQAKAWPPNGERS